MPGFGLPVSKASGSDCKCYPHACLNEGSQTYTAMCRVTQMTREKGRDLIIAKVVDSATNHGICLHNVHVAGLVLPFRHSTI